MIEQLIQKYFSGNCSDSEKKELEEYFRENASEISDYFSEEEWDELIEQPLQKTKDSELFLDGIIADDKPRIKYGKFVWVAAAALIGFIFGTYFLFFAKDNSKRNTTATIQINDLYTPQWIINKNESDTVAIFHLPDASLVKLFPRSEIKYLQKFDSARRDVYLNGEAFFRVQKDARRPFTVYCHDVATTALGTQFSVSSLKRDQVTVLLFEGKVVVKSIHKETPDPQQYYLLPGNGVLYDRESLLFTRIKNSSTELIADINNGAIHGIAGATKDNQNNIAGSIADVKEINQIKVIDSKRVEFNGMPLSKVLSILADKRGVKITYPTDKVASIQFVGVVRDDMPIQKVLSDIAIMNNLELSIDSSGKEYKLK